MNKIERKTERKILLIVLLTISGSFLFYWFQIRPANIKHDCSWVKMHADAVPARDGLTVEQLKDRGMLEKCTPTPTGVQTLDSFLQNRRTILCNERNNDIIQANKSQKYVPEKNWYVKATTAQYTFCLHDNGL